MVAVVDDAVSAQPTGCSATDRAKTKHISEANTIGGPDPTNRSCT
jgi:hypothetical protein